MTTNKPRASEFSFDLEEDAQEPELQMAVFYVGSDLYGIDIMRIRRVLSAKKHPVREVPLTPDVIEGVIRVSGVVIPVVDLRVRFNVEIDHQHDRLNKLVLVSTQGHIVALKVDRVFGELRVPADSVRPTPTLLSGHANEENADFFSGVCKSSQDMVFVLNVEQLIKGRVTGIQEAV